MNIEKADFSVGHRVSIANPARKVERDVTPATTRKIQDRKDL